MTAKPLTESCAMAASSQFGSDRASILRGPRNAGRKSLFSTTEQVYMRHQTVILGPTLFAP